MSVAMADRQESVVTRSSDMSDRTFLQEFAGELALKAVVWGPAIGGVILFGPVGIAVGLAATVAIVCSGGSGDSPAGNTSQSKDTGSST